MLIKKSAQFLGALGCTIALSALVGCGAAPDASAEPTERAASGISAEKASPEQSAAPAEQMSSMPLTGACVTPSQQPEPKNCSPWVDYDCSSCLIDGSCTDFDDRGHPIPGTNRKTVRGQVRGCTPDPWTTYPYWQEYQYVTIDCGC
jgi:hypothetical protein